MNTLKTKLILYYILSSLVLIVTLVVLGFSQVLNESVYTFSMKLLLPIFQFFIPLTHQIAGVQGISYVFFLIISLIITVFSLNYILVTFWITWKRKKISKSFIFSSVFLLFYFSMIFVPFITGCNVLPEKSQDNCLLAHVKTYNNVYLCEIVEDNSKQECFSLVQQKIKNCDSYNNNITKDACLRTLGIRDKDVSVCESIHAPLERDWCIERIAVSTKNMALCDHVDDKWPKGSCVKNLISISGDENDCKKLLDVNAKNECLRNLAKTSGDASHCAEQQDVVNGITTYYKTHCLYGAAMKSKDVRICDEIPDSSYRYDCVNILSKE